MAARYDKYDPKAGGFRAVIDADAVKTGNLPIGYGLDVDGHAVPGSGQTGIVGVVCLPKDFKANDIIDIMTHGEVVDCVGLAAGTLYTANTVTGVISNAAPSQTQVVVGWTVEAARLVVRTARGAAIPATVVVGDQAGVADLTNNTGVVGNDIVENVPQLAVVPAALANAAERADVNASLTAVENNIADVTDKINVLIARLEASGLLTVV